MINIIYYTGKIVMPILGFIFNILTLCIFFNYSYYFFFHFNSIVMYHELLNMEKRDLTILSMTDSMTRYEINDTDYQLILWHETESITIHELNYKCVVSAFTTSKWDRKLNNEIYNLFK